MNRKSRFLLLAFGGLAVLVLAIAFWPSGGGHVELRLPGWAPGGKSEKAEEDAPFDRIEVETGGQVATLVRGADKSWSMTPPEGARPDKYKVRQIVELLREDLVSVVSSSPKAADLEAFGLDDARRVRVTFHRPEGATTVLDIGVAPKPEKGGSAETDSFVRVGGLDRVWRVLGRDLRRPFEGGVKGLRDRKVFAFDVADVTRIEIRDPAAPDAIDRDIRLVAGEPPAAKEGDASRKERSWRFEAPEGLAAGDVQAFLSAVAGIYAQEYLDALPAGVALGDDAYSLRLVLEDGRAVAMRAGAPKDDAAYLAVEGATGYVKVAKYVADQVRKHSGDLRDRRLFGTTRDAILAVDLVDGERKVSFEREGNGFKALTPKGLPLGRSPVESLLTEIENLKADAFLPPSQQAGVQAGLDRPVMTLSVATRDGRRHQLRVGAEKGAGTRFVSMDGAPDLATLPAWALARIRKGPDDLREKTFFDFDLAQVQSIEIAHPDETVVLEFVPGAKSPDKAWRATKPQATNDLKVETVGTLIGTLAGFSAKAIATDAAARKAASGRPELTLSVGLSDGSRRVLKVFAEKKDGDPYAIVSGVPGFRDLVLVLNAFQVRNVQKRLSELKK